MSENLNKKQIQDLLPHREPMLLIDELTNIKKLKSATAIVNVKKESFFVQGHFPGEPVMPGVLIVEAFGQAVPVTTQEVIDSNPGISGLAGSLNNPTNINNTACIRVRITSADFFGGGTFNNAGPNNSSNIKYLCI